jgi:hypothetical protein
MMIASQLSLAGEIYCVSTLENNWDKLDQRNKELVTKDDCIIAEYAGQIEVGDYQKIRDFLDSGVVMYLQLDSNGGNIAEALKIGRLVRRNNLFTFVNEAPEMKVCFSSCFFIWAGGIYRSGYPSIHRPYLPDNGLTKLSLSEADELYLDISESIEQFLYDLRLKQHLPSDFVRVLMSTRPEDVFSMRDFNEMTPTLYEHFEPHVEQFLLDKCGSLENIDCARNVLLFETANNR